jgi:metallo-beta-lactamase class B
MKLLLSLPICVLALAQAPPDRDALPTDPKLLLDLARKADHWDEPMDPIHIAGPIYLVGTKGLSEYLLKTSEGLILINTGMPGSGPLTAASIMRLGFDPKDLKLILVGHAHIDHAGAVAYLQKTYKAKVAIIKEEQALLESGGRTDFFYGEYPEFLFEPAKADIVFNDQSQLKVGDITLTALLTNGHTQGSTTFVTNITDNGKNYNVVFVNGLSINPGYRLAIDESYPGIANNYRHTLEVLESLKPDIWLPPHNYMYNFEAKHARAEKEGAQAYVDPEGYRLFLIDARKEVDDATGVPITKPRAREASRTK